jgi:hypothetical protein
VVDRGSSARHHRRLLWSVPVAGLLATATAAAATQFPGAGYPQPIKARAGGALAACPNPTGLERFDSATSQLAARIARNYAQAPLAVDRRDSDRSWWPQLEDLQRAAKPRPGTAGDVVYGSGEPLAKSAYSVIVRFSCGEALVTKSLSVAIGPRRTHPPYCSACVSSLFFVDRSGHALVYYEY